MMRNVFSGPVAVACGSIAVASLSAASPAATIPVTGPQVGTPGTPGAGTQDPSNPTDYNGNFGGNGYSAGDGVDNYVFTGVTAAGGMGGAITAADTDPTHNYSAGTGGAGVGVSTGATVPPTATINSGTYTGGTGGAATGASAGRLFGGYGGDGVFANGGSVVINGGTFQGGDSGTAAGAGLLGSGFAGSGFNANNNSSVTINGGTFTGGNGAVVPGGGTGSPGAGLIGLSGDVFVHGGTFAAGTGGGTGYAIDLYIGNITLYGTNFVVNGTPVTANTSLTGTGTLTGLLDDNTAATTLTYINRNFGGTLNLVVTPEPAALGLLAATGLLTLRRCR